MPPLIDRHPWFPFVFAFIALLGAWTSMIVIAVKNRPETIPLEHVQNESADPAPEDSGTSPD